MRMEDKGKIGIQMSTIKNKIDEIGVYETMKRCYELGYRCIEISQIPMTAENTAEFVRAREDFGIKVAAINASITAMNPSADTLADNYDKIISDCKTLDCDMLRIGMGPLNRLSSKEEVLKYCEELDSYSTKLKADGIDYYYHNHSVEFAKYDGEYILDIIKNNSSIGFELDIHWIQAGGENPADFIKKYAGRIRLLHLKDFRIVPITMDALRTSSSSGEPQKVNPMYGTIQFAEIGEGNLNIKACMEAGLAGGSEYFLVEQDSTYNRDQFDSLKISRDNLIKLGYEDWF